MSQASTKIGASAAENESALAAAIKTARAKHATRKPVQASRRGPEDSNGGNANMPFTLERSAQTCPTDDRMNKIERTFGHAVPDAAELREKAEEAIGSIGKLLVAAHGEGGEVGTSMSLQSYVEAFVVRACLACEMADTKITNVRLAVSKFNAQRDEDRDGPSGFPSYIENMMEFAARLAVQGYVAHYMAEGAVSAFAHVTGEEWKPRARKAATAPLDEHAAAARLSAFE